MTSPRIHGQRISPSQRRAYAAKLRELWATKPEATIAEVCAATGAPTDLAQAVRSRLVAAGTIPKNVHWRARRAS